VIPLEAVLRQQEFLGVRSTTASPALNFEDFPISRWQFTVGTQAPDFSLPRVSDGREVCLRDLCGSRPALLIFGSFG
jgi:hypothetical protein